MAADIIAPSEIQSELARIWDSLEGTGKMRASLFNLVFYTRKKGRAHYMKSISEKVIQKFPSRVIFISEDPDGGNYINTRVSVLASGAGESEIACDTIQIEAGGSYASRIPFIILPHLLPDLPVYCISGEAPDLSSPLFNQMKKIASRFIFDSEGTSDLSGFATSLLGIQNEYGAAVSDLNWARTESWRALISATFYSEERLAQLKKATKIHILYNSYETEHYHHALVPSLYLQGWISAQLGWKLLSLTQTERGIEITYERPGGKVSLFLVPEERETIKTGAILTLDVETEDQNHFSFGRNLATPHLVSMRISTLKKCDVPLQYVFSKDELGQSLVKEICHKGTSKHFLNLLRSLQGRKEYIF